MGAGVPVVASAVGGVTETLEGTDAGLLVPESAPEALAGALAKLLTMSAADRQTMGQRGRQHVEQQFSMQQMIDRYLDLYRRKLQRAAAAR
jgi:glycosyltransferase involved in cell wall biosynthesis